MQLVTRQNSDMNSDQKQLIEEINLLGPWVHGYFDLGNGVIIEDSDDLQKSRLFAILETLKMLLSKHCETRNSLELTLSDIGCNTGFFIVELLKAFKFKTVIGYEPKSTNLDKAKFIRKRLCIDENRWQLSEYDLLHKPTHLVSTDITMCIGVLHHVDDIFAACRHLHELSNGLVIIECMVLPEILNNEQTKESLELKDIAYQDEEFDGHRVPFGVMGLKHESHYYDGAAAKSGVVTVPTASALCMILESVGFLDVEIVRTETDFQNSHYTENSYRRMNSTVITARKGCIQDTSIDQKIATSTHLIQDKELQVVLPETLILVLNSVIEEPKNNQKSIVSIINRFRNEKHVSQEDQETLSHALSPDELSIVMGFRFQYATKVKFEYAKYLVKYQKLAVAQNILEELIYTQNLDWRVCYRSYYLLAQVMVAKNQIELAELNIKKCLKAYKHFFPALELAKTISSIKMNTQSI